MNYTTLADSDLVNKTIEALGKNGINAEVVENGSLAKERVMTLIPKGSEVMTMTSETLRETGIAEELNESGEYMSVKKMLSEMGKEKSREKRKLGAAPDFAVGSVHAVTHDGQIIIASNTGSQLPAYVNGAGRVIWVVGVQKIVKDKEEGMRRIQDYILPLESERSRKAYNLDSDYQSFVSKVVVINRELNKKRLHLIFVKEKLGF